MLVRPLSNVDNTRDYACVSHSRQWSNYNLTQWILGAKITRNAQKLKLGYTITAYAFIVTTKSYQFHFCGKYGPIFVFLFTATFSDELQSELD